MAEKHYSFYSDTEILDQRMAVEIGNDHIVLVAGADGKVSGLEYYSTEDSLDETLDNISQESILIKKNYSETRVFYNLEEAVLVPVGQFNSSIASEFVDLAFGDKAASRVNVENINVSPGIVNVYRSNDDWQEVIGRHFRAVTKRHLYSKLVENVVTDNELKLVFYKSSFIIIGVKDGHLKIIRSIDFSSDADALYHILNVCRQVDISLKEIPVSICGLVDTDASLFQLLEKYCDTILINNSPALSLPPGTGKYPTHYFTSFINLLS